MNRISRRMTIGTGVAVAVAVFTLPAAAATSDYFLKLEGTKGESKVEIAAHGWGETQEAGDASDALTDGLLIVRSRPAAAGLGLDPARADGHGPASKKVSVLEVDHEVQSPRDAASGQATGKRMHKPLMIYDEPLAAGSLTLRASVPGCTPGDRYAGAQFAAGNKLYELRDVVISGCAPNGVLLNYRKVTVKGWNPETKEL